MYEAEVSVKNSEDLSLFSPVVNPLSDPLVSSSSEELSSSPQELTAGPLATIHGFAASPLLEPSHHLLQKTLHQFDRQLLYRIYCVRLSLCRHNVFLCL